MGKGSGRRPAAVSQDQWDEHFNNIFQKKPVADVKHPDLFLMQENEPIARLMGYVRCNPQHGRVVDLVVDGRIRCVCINCWQSWEEEGIGGYPMTCRERMCKVCDGTGLVTVDDAGSVEECPAC